MKRPIRLLVVAPVSAIRNHMIDYLESHLMCDISTTVGKTMLGRFAASKPDLIVLDTRSCKTNGLGLLRSLRSATGIPLIVIDKYQPSEVAPVTALDLGADDYITDPIGLRELVARIRAVLRRSNAPNRPPSGERKRGRRRFAGWVHDPEKRELTSPIGLLVPLTKGEHALLTAFLDAPLNLDSGFAVSAATQGFSADII